MLLLNGGARPAKNYYSHLDNLRRIVALLEAEGTRPDQITIFASDGPDPEPDLATREGERHPEFWLLPSKGVAQALRPPILYENSELGDYELRPATRAALEAWFEGEGRRLEAGETLLFYVTDHGRRGAEDASNATISLWRETLTVDELRELLGRIDPGVRVVMLMSQCFSGSFANVIVSDERQPAGADPVIRSSVCGYFSATATRKASGCYPEVSGKQALGHSHRVFEALARVRSFPEVQREVVLTDRTPNVPHATTDFYLERLLSRAAAEDGIARDVLVDRELARAQKAGSFDAQFELVDRVAASFGFAPPRSLAELQLAAVALPELSRKLGRFTGRWRKALEALRAENLRLFLEARPEWDARLEPELLRQLRPEARRRLADELLAELVPFTRAAVDRILRLRRLRDKYLAARKARYRTEVRVAVVLRMRMLLTRIAGEQYLSDTEVGEEGRIYADLASCEDVSLGIGSGIVQPDEPAPSPQSFGTLSEERALLESLSPSWLGVRYEALPPAELEQAGLSRGPVRVVAVLRDSPASRAGMQVGDIVLGPPEAPFRDPQALREFVMQSPVDVPIPMQVLRGEETRTLRLALRPYPLVLPKIEESEPAGKTPPSKE